MVAQLVNFALCVLLKPFDCFRADPHWGSDLLDYLIVFLLELYDNLAAGL